MSDQGQSSASPRYIPAGRTDLAGRPRSTVRRHQLRVGIRLSAAADGRSDTQANAPRPLVVSIHSGAWLSGIADTCPKPCDRNSFSTRCWSARRSRPRERHAGIPAGQPVSPRSWLSRAAAGPDSLGVECRDGLRMVAGSCPPFPEAKSVRAMVRATSECCLGRHGLVSIGALVDGKPIDALPGARHGEAARAAIAVFDRLNGAAWAGVQVRAVS